MKMNDNNNVVDNYIKLPLTPNGDLDLECKDEMKGIRFYTDNISDKFKNKLIKKLKKRLPDILNRGYAKHMMKMLSISDGPHILARDSNVCDFADGFMLYTRYKVILADFTEEVIKICKENKQTIDVSFGDDTTRHNIREVKIVRK